MVLEKQVLNRQEEKVQQGPSVDKYLMVCHA